MTTTTTTPAADDGLKRINFSAAALPQTDDTEPKFSISDFNEMECVCVCVHVCTRAGQYIHIYAKIYNTYYMCLLPDKLNRIVLFRTILFTCVNTHTHTPTQANATVLNACIWITGIMRLHDGKQISSEKNWKSISFRGFQAASASNQNTKNISALPKNERWRDNICLSFLSFWSPNLASINENPFDDFSAGTATRHTHTHTITFNWIIWCCDSSKSIVDCHLGFFLDAISMLSSYCLIPSWTSHTHTCPQLWYWVRSLFEPHVCSCAYMAGDFINVHKFVSCDDVCEHRLER